MPKPITTRTLFLEELKKLEDRVGQLTDELAKQLEQLVLKHAYGDPNTEGVKFKDEQAMRRRISALMAGYIAVLSDEVTATNKQVASIRMDDEVEFVTGTIRKYKQLTAGQRATILRNIKNDARQTINDIEKILTTRQPFLDNRGVVYRYKTVQRGATKTVNNILDLGLRNRDSAKTMASKIRQYIKPELAQPAVSPKDVMRERYGYDPSADVKIRGGSVEFNSMRIARTETQRTYREVPARLAKNKKYAKGIKWNLSNAHPKPDICDQLAEQNKHKLGKGVYPIDKLPNSHPNCLCYTTTVILTEAQFLKLIEKGKI